jgi:O-antigen ligase
MIARPPATTLRLPGSGLGRVFGGSALTDLSFLLALLPLWWALGVEQWLPTVALAAATLKLAVTRRRIVRSLPLALMLLLLVAMLASALFVTEAERYLSFARLFAVHLTGALAWIIVTTEARTWSAVRSLLVAVTVAMASAGVLGALGFLGVAELHFSSPFGYLLPDSIRRTDYGSVIAMRSTGGQAWFSLLGTYYRTNSVFLFSTMYAAALAITIPVAVFLATTTRGWRRVLVVLLVALLGLNLVFTTGRAALTGLVLGAVVYTYVRFRPWGRTVSFAAFVSIAAALAALVGPGRFVDAFEGVVVARGAGSVDARSLIYTETIRGALDRPLFGWGTERDIDVAGFRYPAGSHSLYLAVLFRHGIVGFALLLGLLASVWWTTAPARSPPGRPGDPARSFVAFGRWSLTAFLVFGISTVPDVDMTLHLIAWTCLAAVYAANRLHSTNPTAGTDADEHRSLVGVHS